MTRKTFADTHHPSDNDDAGRPVTKMNLYKFRAIKRYMQRQRGKSVAKNSHRTISSGHTKKCSRQSAITSWYESSRHESGIQREVVINRFESQTISSSGLRRDNALIGMSGAFARVHVHTTNPVFIAFRRQGRALGKCSWMEKLIKH